MGALTLGRTGDKSKYIPLFAALVIAATTAPAAYAQGPGVDEYTLRGPDAKGPGHLGPEAPASRPEELPQEIREALADSPDGEKLAEIATARELGAPTALRGRTPAADDADPSAPGAALNALGSPPGLALLAVVAALVAGGFYLRARRSA